MPPLMLKIFKFFNRFFMVPMFLLGFGAFFGNPFSGYIMVLKVLGRKSGKLRYAPVNYAIHNGQIYCISGGRQSSDWYKNILAHPEIEMILPTGAVYARAVETSDSQERLVVARKVLTNAGFAGFFEGYNPFKINDDELAEKIVDLPILRFQTLGLGNGAFDRHGWAWIWSFVFTALVIVLLILAIK